MLIRQKIMLSLVDQIGGQISRLRLVKSAFLFVQTSNSSKMRTFYQFVPYRHGPFSFTLYHELDTLSRNGYIMAASNDEIQLSRDVPIPPLDYALTGEIARFSRECSKLSTEALINRVYSRYPWFTINAEESERRMADRPKAECAVYTVGYEGLQVDGFLNILLQAGVQQLVDVRCNPISRRYGFHKSTLSTLCQRLGIKYKHMPEVGIPSELRTDLQHPSDYEQLFQLYEQKLLTVQRNAVKMIAGWVRSQPSVLVCMEADPESCHRLRLAKQIANHTKLTIHDLREGVCNLSIPKQEFLLPL
jgi:uncharacterized protein (DUF488 family)